MTEYLFSYGTLQKPELQKALFGRILKGLPDTLIGYKEAAIEITDQAFLAKGESVHQLTLLHTKEDGDRIYGTVFEVTEKELLLTDQYEPQGYHRIKTVLRSGKNAWIYIAE